MIELLKRVRPFMGSLALLVILNLLIKPVWVFWIDRQVQNLAGLEAYGTYFALMNLCLVLNILLDVGITPHVNRVIASQPALAEHLLTRAISQKILLSAVYTVSILMLAWMSGVVASSLLLLLVLLQITISLLLLFRAALTASGLYWQDAVISVFDKVLVILLAGFWLYGANATSAPDIQFFVCLQLIAVCFSILLAALFLRKSIMFSLARLRLHVDWTIIYSGLPYALNVFFMTALMRADGFLIERLSSRGSGDAGIYASAFRIVDTINMMGFLVGGFLVSYIARQQQSVQETRLVIRLSHLFLLIPAVLLASGGWFFSEEINGWLYHHAAAETSQVIRILLLTLPALAFIQVYGSVLTSTGNIRVFRNASFIFALLIILADLFIVPLFGVIGGAWTAVIVQSIYAITVTVLSARKTDFSINSIDLLVIGVATVALVISLN